MEKTYCVGPRKPKPVTLVSVIFILCGAAGLRIGELLGIEIDKHISSDFLTLHIQQQVRRGRIDLRLKTANAFRQVDLHPAIATRLKQFVGRRKVGLLFCTSNGEAAFADQHNSAPPAYGAEGTELHQSIHWNAQSWKLCVPPFRNTYLRNYTECPERLYKY